VKTKKRVKLIIALTGVLNYCKGAPFADDIRESAKEELNNLLNKNKE